YVCVLRLDVDVDAEVRPHEPVVPVDDLRLHRVVLVEVKGYDVGEIETFLAVHLDQLSVDADRSAARRKSQNGMSTFSPALLDYLGDSLGDGFGNLVVLDDYYRDAFFGGGHIPLKYIDQGGALM